MVALPLLAALLLANPESASDPNRFPTPSGTASEAAAILTEIADRPDADQRATLDQMDRTVAAIEKALPLLSAESPVGERLAEALQRAKSLPTQEGLPMLRQAIEDASDELAFEPVQEAPLPEGFPTYTLVGAIEVKQYAEHRMAVGSSFFPLFQHIQQNNVAMTAPVQMDYQVADSGRVKNSAMAFFYGDAEIGKTGAQGNVQVMDVKPIEVVSLGMRGATNDRAIREAHDRLTKWLASQTEYERAGDLRVMGYNSPALERTKNFYEVQIPIRKVQD